MKGLRRADRFGPRPMQRASFPDMVFRSSGASMARRGIVTVTVNYRFCVFGFFAHPDLTAESPNLASGNYGFLDQVEGLHWVQQNIRAFGGDPGRVTIAGQSAGAMSVSALMASPLSKKLFTGAIGESGAILGTRTTVLLQQAEQNGARFAGRLGASIDEMRKMLAGEAANLYAATDRSSVIRAATDLASDQFAYALGNLSIFNVYAWAQNDLAVERIMQGYFVNFIRKGDPNGAGLPAWPALTKDEAPLMRIDVQAQGEPEKNRQRYLFLDNIYNK